MKLQIFPKDIELTENINDLVDKKFVSKIEKFFKKNDDENLRLTLEHGTRWGYRAKFEAGKIFVETKHKELRSAIVELAEDVVRILRREKEKNSH